MSATDAPLRIFLSYRRDDSQGFAGRIYDRLSDRFGSEAVFRDINDIEPGRPWAEAIDEALVSCDVFVLLIGREWLNATDDDGHRRIDDPEDRHRREIESAVNRHIRMFVALMENAPMPDKDQLPRQPARQQPDGGQAPKGLQELPNLQAVVIADFAFDYGIERLITSIETAAQQEGADIAKRRPVAVPERGREEAAKPHREAPLHRRRVWMLAALALGTVAVIVGVFLLAGSGDDGVPTTKGGSTGGGSVQDVEDLPVGQRPVGLAPGPQGMWVTDADTDMVWLIKASPKGIERGTHVAVGRAPAGAVVQGHTVWIANSENGSVSILPGGTNVAEEIPVRFGEPYGIAVGPGSVWVADRSEGSVSQIDPGSQQRIGDPITVGSDPEGIAVDDGGVAWVANSGETSISMLDPESNYEDHQIEVGGGPTGIDVDDDGFIWVAKRDAGSVSRIDPRDPDDPEEFEVDSGQLGVAAAFGYVWLSLGEEKQVARLDPETRVVDRIDVDTAAEGIVDAPHAVWVASGEAGKVVRITP